MSSNSISESLGKAKAFDDSDLTPRPLKVMKENPFNIADGNESFVTAVEEQRAAIPRRKSSLNHSASSDAMCEPPMVQSPPPRHHGPLRVPKQRTDKATLRQSEDEAQPPSGDSQILLLQSLGRKQIERDIKAAEIGFRKFVRNSVLPHRLSRKLITPVANVLTKDPTVSRRNLSENKHPNASQHQAKNQYRAFTDGQVYEKSDFQSHPPPSRRFSFKDRLVGRSMSRKLSADRLVPKSANNTGQDHPGMSSIASSVCSINKAMERFPLIPSQQQPDILSDHESVKVAMNHEPLTKVLSEPHGASILAGRLSFTPEFEDVSFENGDSVFALAQFEAMLSSVETVETEGTLRTALDFVCIIDNSATTSPSTLMAHCETARYLASILNAECDQIALLCTSTESETFRPVASLAPVEVRSFKKAIDRIGTFCDTMETASISSLLSVAQDMLLHQTSAAKAVGQSTTVYGHICVLTHRPWKQSEVKLPDARLTVHHMCSDALPIRQEELPATNGWRMRSQSVEYPQPVTRNGIKHGSNEMANKIESLVSQARTGRKLGVLSNVEWELCSCKDTTIEKVWGQSRIEKMQPGDVSTLIVKIKCNKPLLATAWLAGDVPSFEENGDMFGELERLFSGLSGTPLLRAAVSYSHSALPKDTVCASIGTCYAKRYISSPGRPSLDSRPKSALFSAHRVAVHKALALHCFTQLNHEAAVTQLKNILGEAGKKVACGKFITDLVKHVQYQSGPWRKSLSNGAGKVKTSGSATSGDDLKVPTTQASPNNRETETSGDRTET